VELMAGVELPEATPADLERLVEHFRTDAEARAALSQTHIVHWARGTVYGMGGVIPLSLAETLGAVREVRAARAEFR
jgi:hypothetical protein